MKKIPSALKWLAEKRARVAGELASCTQVKATLVADVDALRLKLGTTEEMLEAAARKSARLTEELDALDKTMPVSEIVKDSTVTLRPLAIFWLQAF